MKPSQLTLELTMSEPKEVAVSGQEDDLVTAPVEDVEVQKQPTPVQPKVGTKEFCELLHKEFSDGKVWRSTEALAKKMNVDVVELDKFLRGQAALCCRPSKEEGVFLYALVSRVEQSKEKENKTVETAMRPLVAEEDRYALASIHSAFVLLEAALQKFALKIHERNPEAFTQLVAGKDKLEAGLVLYGQRLKADMSKLPKV